MHKWATLIITHYIFIITVIRLSSNPSTYKLFFLVLYSSGKIGTFHAWSNRTSKYFICFLTNILLRSERFTKQSFAMEKKFLPRTDHFYINQKEIYCKAQNLLQQSHRKTHICQLTQFLHVNIVKYFQSSTSRCIRRISRYIKKNSNSSIPCCIQF